MAASAASVDLLLSENGKYYYCFAATFASQTKSRARLCKKFLKRLKTKKPGEDLMACIQSIPKNMNIYDKSTGSVATIFKMNQWLQGASHITLQLGVGTGAASQAPITAGAEDQAINLTGKLGSKNAHSITYKVVSPPSSWSTKLVSSLTVKVLSKGTDIKSDTLRAAVSTCTRSP
jgi:hypothetical protein